MNQLKLTFILALCLGLFVGFICGRNWDRRVVLPPADAETAVGAPMKSIEAEKEQFELFLSRVEQVEGAALDWFRDHASTAQRATYFLTDEGQKSLSVSVQDVLHCVIDKPQAQYPHCNNDYFHFYDFGCDYQGCTYIFCRAGEDPYLCLYSGSGYLDPHTLRWEHSANILDEKALPLGKWLYETHHWQISEML